MSVLISLQYVGCQVGANPQPNVEGCLVDSGALTIPDYKMTITYTYEPLSDNVLFRAFEGFSEFAQDFLGECEGNCPYPVYTDFYDYYGVYDYGDNLISSAFDGSSTMLGNGNMDFSIFGDAGRAGTRMLMAGKDKSSNKSGAYTDFHASQYTSRGQ